jgi:multidrug/hemolysin transport system permease protein
MIGFTIRNLLIFFRDKTTVFFSLLASFIIIGLYVLFLGDVWTNSFTGIENAREFMDNWVMAGLLAVTSVTTTLGAFGTMINDKTRKINKDFYSSPVKRSALAGGYILSAFIIGFILSIVTLILAELYIVAEGGAWMSFDVLLKVIGIILLADFSNTALMFLIASFVSSENAFSTVSTVIGTVIGFITGIYLPIGNLPEAVRWIIKLFPPSHAASLLRQVMMKEALYKSFANVPTKYASELKEFLGVTFRYGDWEVTASASIGILIAAGILFYLLATWVMSRKKK